MAVRDQRVNQIINQGKQLGKNILLLAHYTTVFAVFVGRFVECIVGAIKWTTTFTHYTASAFDFIYRHLQRGQRRRAAAGAREMTPDSDKQPQWLFLHQFYPNEMKSLKKELENIELMKLSQKKCPTLVRKTLIFLYF